MVGSGAVVSSAGLLMGWSSGRVGDGLSPAVTLVLYNSLTCNKSTSVL